MSKSPPASAFEADNIRFYVHDDNTIRRAVQVHLSDYAIEVLTTDGVAIALKPESARKLAIILEDAADLLDVRQKVNA